MYNKDYEIENNPDSIKRAPYDDTLYVLSQFLNHYHNRNNPILDLGSGDGHYHTYFELHTFVGLDLNKTKNSKSNDILIEQNIEEFPYTKNIPNEYIPSNFIISLDTFEHLERPDKILDYLKQDDHILNKNSYIFISVPNINILDDKLNNTNPAIYDPRLKRNTSGRWNATHLRFFDKDSLYYMAQETGFEIEAITGSNFHTSDLFNQMAKNFGEIGVDGISVCNILRNTEFVHYAPNLCILLKKI